MQLFDRLDDTMYHALPEHERMLLDAVRSLARDKIAPRAAALDAEQRFPWENIADINALELNRVFIPEAYGGVGLSFAVYIACVREIAKACASTGIIWSTNFHALKPLIDFGTEEQKKRLLPTIADGGIGALAITEPTAGSDATGMKTRFTPHGEEIVIDGGKIFITNGDVADLYFLFGKWSELGDGKNALSVVILPKDTPGLKILRKEDKMGHRGSSTAALAFEGCRVPRTNLVGRPGEGLKILFGTLNKSRPSVAAHALGIARAAFEDATAYVNERRQSNRRIIDNQGIRFMLADMAAELALCEGWLWHVVRLLDSGVEDVGVEASLLKMRASDCAMRLTTDAVQLHGGYGYVKDYRVERLMRDAKITQIWEGTNQIHRQLIGRSFAH